METRIKTMATTANSALTAGPTKGTTSRLRDLRLEWDYHIPTSSMKVSDKDLLLIAECFQGERELRVFLQGLSLAADVKEYSVSKYNSELLHAFGDGDLSEIGEDFCGYWDPIVKALLAKARCHNRDFQSTTHECKYYYLEKYFWKMYHQGILIPLPDDAQENFSCPMRSKWVVRKRVSKARAQKSL